MATRLLPYAGMSTPQIVMEVLGHGMRPPRPGSGCACPPALWEIMQECWQENRKLRPTFAQLVPRLEVRCAALRCCALLAARRLEQQQQQQQQHARAVLCVPSFISVARAHTRTHRLRRRAPFPRCRPHPHVSTGAQAVLAQVNQESEVELLRPAYGREAEEALSAALRSEEHRRRRHELTAAAAGQEGQGQHAGQLGGGADTPESVASSGPGEIL
jgi:hypothetical protein